MNRKQKVLLVEVRGEMVFPLEALDMLMDGLCVKCISGYGKDAEYVQDLDREPSFTIINAEQLKISEVDSKEAMMKELKDAKQTNSDHWNARWKMEEQIKKLKAANDALTKVCPHTECEEEKND